MLESLIHESNAFVTLTYDDKHLPGDKSVSPVDMQKWLKRFRKAVEPSRIRFFGVGEYGDETWRPHYHVAIFGHESCLRGRTDHRLKFCCPVCDLFRKTWSFGGVDLGQLEGASAQYLAGYVVKKMTSEYDYRLNGLHPEFARMSNRPGIGANAMAVVAEQLHCDFALDDIISTGDIPMNLKYGKRSIPLGRYLRERLRVEMGMPDAWKDRIKQKWALEKSVEVQELFKEAIADTARSTLSPKAAFVEENLGRVRSIESRSKLVKRRQL